MGTGNMFWIGILLASLGFAVRFEARTRFRKACRQAISEEERQKLRMHYMPWVCLSFMLVVAGCVAFIESI